VASAGPYASLHLAPDRQPCQHPTTLFLQAGCPSCRPTNSVKALKEKKHYINVIIINIIISKTKHVRPQTAFIIIIIIRYPKTLTSTKSISAQHMTR